MEKAAELCSHPHSFWLVWAQAPQWPGLPSAASERPRLPVGQAVLPALVMLTVRAGPAVENPEALRSLGSLPWELVENADARTPSHLLNQKL